MAEPTTRDTELVLPPGTYAYVLDGTKGHVSAYCGPFKSSLSNTDQLVIYNKTTARFDTSSGNYAIQNNVICPKGWYIVLENPATNNRQPEAGKFNDLPVGTLRYGSVENIPGPQSFPLWPGQVANVIKGHHLRSNQYLMVRIADDEAAQANWDKSVVKKVAAEHPTKTDDETPPEKITDVAQSKSVLGIDANTLVTGQLIIVKGTDVAFYIPPTGVEVLKDEKDEYVRDAATLERLEYCILKDEDGNKEYRRGPDVVFPSPTQHFHTQKVVSDSGEISMQRNFRAFELQPNNGVYIKVIADYEDGDGKRAVSHKAGEELFITGEELAIYYPREEHAILSYGGHEKTYAVAIPAGEGRYVLDRKTGAIALRTGPDMFLPNPIKEVIVRRILTESECSLLYPGNLEVADFNETLREKGVDVASDPATLSNSIARVSSPSKSELLSYDRLSRTRNPSGSNAQDTLVRSTAYTPPRMITLNTKFDGAIRVEVWSGYAIQLVNSKGQRKTVLGPKTVLLEYDEYLEKVSLSTGTPKSDAHLLQTPYLKHISNPISDIISLKTQDLVDVDVRVKYLVRFEEENSEHWFSMDNYVQYMVDHLRSMIGNSVRNISIQEFYVNATNVLRDVVLGAKNEDGERILKHFDENGMTVYDLELISVTIRNRDVADMLSRTRQEMLAESIELERAVARTEHVKGVQEAERGQLTETNLTVVMKATLESEQVARDATLEATRKKNDLAIASAKKAIEDVLLEIERSKRDLEAAYLEGDADRKIKLEQQFANAHATRMAAITPSLVESLVSLSQTGQLQSMAEHLAPLALVRGESLGGTLEKMLAGTPLENMLKNVQTLAKPVR